MKVMLVTPYFAPRIGGLEQYAMHIAQELEARGWEVVVVTSKPSGTPDETRVEGIRVIRLPAWKVISNTPVHPAWFRQLRQSIAHERPAIINVHTPVPGLADVAACVARVPLVVTYHASTLFKHRAPLFNILAALYLPVQRLLFRRADAIVCVSSYARSRLPASVQHKAVVISNAVTPPRAKRVSVTTDVVCIASLDRTHRWKGIRDVLRAVRAYHDTYGLLKLSIVGDGNDRHAYERLATRLGITAYVTFLGALNDSQKWDALRAARVYTHYPTTANDACPTTLLEAWAVGVPVVAAAIGPMPSLLTANDGVLVPPRNPARLADAWHTVLQQPKTIPSNGKARVKKEFLWRHAGERTDALLRRFVS